MNNEKINIIRARDVMQSQFHYIDGMATAREAAELMRSANTDVLLVNKRNPDDATGIIAVQDIITGVLLSGRQADKVNVYEIMTKPVISVPASMDIKYVIRMLTRAGIRRAPVEENGEYVGMISLATLVLEKGLI